MQIFEAPKDMLLVWKERKLVSGKVYTPDDFDPSVLELVSRDEGEALNAMWEAEAEFSAQED